MSNTKQEENNTEVVVKEEINDSKKTSSAEKKTRKKSADIDSLKNKQTEAPVDISPFVSNPEGNIYAIKNLPEEFVATLFAWVSRSPKSFKEHLQMALKEFDIEVPKQDTFTSLDKKAKDFHEKWTVGYGHSSVAEHAVAHVGIENVSRLASADLELSNTFYSITEYSQRYQKPKRGDWHNPFKKNSKEHKEFEQSMNECFDSFEKLIDGVLKDLCQKEGIPFKTEKTETVEIIRKRKALEKLAFEDARYVLPLAMYTQLGMTANGRAWRDGLAKLETSKYTEVQDMRKALKEEITKVLPVLLKYADASPYQKKHQSVIESNFNSTQDDQALQRDVKVLIVSLERLEVLNILALYYVQQSNIPYSVALNRARELDYEKRNQIIEQLLFDMKHFDTAPEAFKSVNYQVELKVSEANWHQLLRHNRKTDFIFAGPSMQNGLVIPPRIKAAGLEHLLVNLHENVFAQYVSFVEKGFDQEADYLVLNAHKRRVVANFDLMEVYHLINLRTSDEAQWDIKNTFNELYDVLSQYHPHLMKQAKRRI